VRGYPTLPWFLTRKPYRRSAWREACCYLAFLCWELNHATESPRCKEEADAAVDAAAVGQANVGGERA